MRGRRKREPLWIMVSGPYTSGAKSAANRRRNLAIMNKAAVAVLRKGHVPIIGVNLALPIIAAAGGAKFYDEIMMPLSLAAAERCDAVLRVGGPSRVQMRKSRASAPSV